MFRKFKLRAVALENAKRLLLVVLGVGIGLLGGEILVRAFNVAPNVDALRKGRFQISRNPKIAYERVPNLQYDGEALDFYDFRGRSNSLGYRSPEYGIPKPAGVKRIVVLGDSIAEGGGVMNDDEVFPRRVERLLRARGYDVQVLTFAVSGYNTQQEVETLREKALVFSPDIVLLQYCLNDREGISPWIMPQLIGHVRSNNLVDPGLEDTNRILLSSALYRFIKFKVFGWQMHRDALLSSDRYVTSETVEASLVNLADLARRHQFQVVVVIFPLFSAHDPYSLSYPYLSEHQIVRRGAEELGFAVLDLLPVFRDCAGRMETPESLATDIYHPSSVGHDCAARGIDNFLLGKHLLSNP